MSISQKEKLLVETTCDLCGESMGTSLIDPSEYGDWLKHTTDLLTFMVVGPPGSAAPDEQWQFLLCWACIKKLGLTKEYDRRLNDLTYGPKTKDKK